MHRFIILFTILITACGQPAPDLIAIWRTAVEIDVKSILTALNDFNQHMPRYYHEPADRQAVERNMDTIQQAHQRLTRLSVPATCAAVHARLLDATADCANGMDAYRAAFRTNNQPDTAAFGQQLVKRCTDKLEELRRKLPSA